MTTFFRNIILIILFSQTNIISVYSQVNTKDEIVRSIRDKYNVNIIYDSIVGSSWEKLRYEKADKDSLLSYLKLIHKEINKYPTDFFNKINIRKLILTSELAIDSQKRAAVPDSELEQMFLSVYTKEKEYNQLYKQHVFHHELSHCTEYKIWNNYYKKWGRWRRANHRNFRYGAGGTEAYKNPKFNWRGTSNRKEGFLNQYSMLSQEEDRSEITAFIMTDIERDTIINLIKQDKILRKKVKLLNILYKRKFNYKDSFIKEIIL